MSVDRHALSGTDDLSRALIACGEAAWELPLVLFADWWNVMAAPAFAASRHRIHPDPEDHQLVVPDPIEEEGEHALFA